ncbi:MAG TPA: hypothetical protein PLI73_06470 [Candidatus Cloacimonadota bacterium]|nr:hypothetical protein [Candidatus Cloacimonadota bacterium]
MLPLARDLGYDGPPFIWDEERRFQIRCELDALFFHLYLGTQSIWESSPTQAPEMALGSGQPHAGSTHSIQGESSRQPSLLAAHPSRNPAHPSPLTAYFPTPRHAVDYIMESFPIVKRKDEKAHGFYRTKQRILEFYDAMAPLFQSSSGSSQPSQTIYTSPLDPPPGPPCDAEGNFIPAKKWDMNSWPAHIHKPGGASE